MSEFRQDSLTGEWVAFASERSKRPYDFAKPKLTPKDGTDCPFCPGHEEVTTSPVFQNGGDKAWTIRAFPNMYPAVSLDSKEEGGEPFYRSLNGVGIHEVVVDTPIHAQEPHQFTKEHFYEVLKVLQQRHQSIQRNENVQYVQIFKNSGPDAGASILHSHWQVMGVPVIPRNQQLAVQSLRTYHSQTGRCLLCDIIQQEQKTKKRVIAENNDYIVFAPYASKLAYEMWIMPKAHIPNFPSFSIEQLSQLTDMMLLMLKKITKVSDGVCYNICFQDSPKKLEDQFHWYARLVPRLGSFAGFEFSTGSYINPVLPEEAAAFYRNA